MHPVVAANLMGGLFSSNSSGPGEAGQQNTTVPTAPPEWVEDEEIPDAERVKRDFNAVREARERPMDADAKERAYYRLCARSVRYALHERAKTTGAGHVHVLAVGEHYAARRL